MTGQLPSRRSLVRMLLGSFALLPMVSHAARATVPGESDLRSQALGNLFRHRSSAIAIGNAYLRGHPQERNLQDLLQALFEGAPGPDVRGEPIAGRRYFEKKIRNDFQAERTVTVEGWVLSLTEARLCAAITLL